MNWRETLRVLRLALRAYRGDVVAAVELWRILRARKPQLIPGPKGTSSGGGGP